jgi:anthranilate synthase/aminodeoxychorismate synthase-like glutamine amidotransferase
MSANNRVVLIDHYDSFTFLLAEQFARFGADVRTYRLPGSLEQFQKIVTDVDPALVVLSPGPGHPTEVESTLDWLRSEPKQPVLGVCLGHQAMGVATGGKVGRAPSPVHGMATEVKLGDDPRFGELPATIRVGRYHSLTITEVAPDLEVIGTGDEGGTTIVMAVRHRKLPWLGVQFHPESCLTPMGGVLVRSVCASAGIGSLILETIA